MRFFQKYLSHSAVTFFKLLVIFQVCFLTPGYAERTSENYDVTKPSKQKKTPIKLFAALRNTFGGKKEGNTLLTYVPLEITCSAQMLKKDNGEISKYDLYSIGTPECISKWAKETIDLGNLILQQIDAIKATKDAKRKSWENFFKLKSIHRFEKPKIDFMKKFFTEETPTRRLWDSIVTEFNKLLKSKTLSTEMKKTLENILLPDNASNRRNIFSKLKKKGSSAQKEVSNDLGYLRMYFHPSADPHNEIFKFQIISLPSINVNDKNELSSLGRIVQTDLKEFINNLHKLNQVTFLHKLAVYVFQFKEENKFLGKNVKRNYDINLVRSDVPLIFKYDPEEEKKYTQEVAIHQNEMKEFLKDLYKSQGQLVTKFAKALIGKEIKLINDLASIKSLFHNAGQSFLRNPAADVGQWVRNFKSEKEDKLILSIKPKKMLLQVPFSNYVNGYKDEHITNQTPAINVSPMFESFLKLLNKWEWAFMRLNFCQELRGKQISEQNASLMSKERDTESPPPLPPRSTV